MSTDILAQANIFEVEGIGRDAFGGWRRAADILVFIMAGLY